MTNSHLTTATSLDDSATPFEPLIRSARVTKIQPRHRDRLAIVYIRQSTPMQIVEHAESTARQYDLAKHAVALGWAPGRVVVIDEDQGKSGRDAAQRAGFQRLLSEVTLGHVGLVLGLEMSRLARSSKDWHHLLELCAVFGALLGDQDGVYDPIDSNDRLLLGLKGAMSEFELVTMRNRLERGKQNKAERGELHIAPPLGYERRPSGEVVLDSDEQARGVLRLIFDKFEELGTARRVLVYLIQNKVRLGFRWNRGPRRGHLDWRTPTYGTVLRILTHPNYAGAYVFGRKDCEPGACGREPDRGKLNRYRADAWRTLLKDRMPAYISWERYEANQKRLQNNRSVESTPGASRAGAALLTGLVVCGTCGRRFNTQYPSGGRGYYLCTRHLQNIEAQICHGLTARVVDRLVSAQVLAALQPAALALSLRAIADEQKERERLEEHWQQKLERARYAAGRAERQYQSVEPENRLVARTLEKQWEDALLELRRLEEDFDRFARVKPVRLTDAERSRIVTLSADITTLWEAAGTTHADRKEIIRCLVERVVVRVHQNTERCEVVIHWNGGHTTHHTMTRPVQSQRQLRDEVQLRERVTVLHRQSKSAAAIATILNAEGYSPPRRETYGADQVRWLFRYYGLNATRPREELKAGEWWLRDLAARLKLPVRKLRDWGARKWCQAHQRATDKRWVVWANAEEVQRLGRLAKQSKLGQSGYPRELTTPLRKK